MNQEYTILLYYKYVHIKDPELAKIEQKAICEALGLTGRIIVAGEGINGTVEGKTEDCEKYITWMSKQKYFKNIDWKKSIGDGTSFPKLSVKVRKEIVSLHLADDGWDIDPTKLTGKRLKAEELDKMYENGEEFYVVDMRNDYELEVGKFEGTVFPGLENFRDLKDRVKEIEHLKDKKVVTVCTGGVRCEKASGFLLSQGFKDVAQLDNGMVTYMEKFPNKAFKGSLYVFDKRKTVTFDDPEKHVVIGKCHYCKGETENYFDCAYPFCHKQKLGCVDHVVQNSGYCKEECKALHEKNKVKA
jgi:UPF0176 protein